MNKNLIFFWLFLTTAQNQGTATSPQKIFCSDASTISTLTGDCSVSMIASIENNRITFYSFEIHADTESLQTECVVSAERLKNLLLGLTPTEILTLPEHLLLEQRPSLQPLADSDPELHKVILLRTLKNGLLAFLAQAH